MWLIETFKNNKVKETLKKKQVSFMYESLFENGLVS